MGGDLSLHHGSARPLGDPKRLLLRGLRGIAIVTAVIALLPQVGVEASLAQAAPRPTPTLPSILGDPEPEPEPEPEPSPTEKPSTQPDGRPSQRRAASEERASEKQRRQSKRTARSRGKNTRGRVPAWVRYYETRGYFSTEDISSATARFVGRKTELRLYRGLPIMGPSSWTDSWGAPRHEFGVNYRRHQGQDLFCRRGAPVLAIDDGRIEFGRDALGGKVARLHLATGDYWYYAHLSRWSTTLRSGSDVKIGEVLGYCGTSGNAAGTPPHLHLGLYVRGVATNPIDVLERALSRAEARAILILQRARGNDRKMDRSGKLGRPTAERCPLDPVKETAAGLLLDALLSNEEALF